MTPEITQKVFPGLSEGFFLSGVSGGSPTWSWSAPPLPQFPPEVQGRDAPGDDLSHESGLERVVVCTWLPESRDLCVSSPISLRSCQGRNSPNLRSVPPVRGGRYSLPPGLLSFVSRPVPRPRPGVHGDRRIPSHPTAPHLGGSGSPTPLGPSCQLPLPGSPGFSRGGRSRQPPSDPYPGPHQDVRRGSRPRTGRRATRV